MMKKSMKLLAPALMALAIGAPQLALAKLPAPTPEARAKAAEAAARTAWNGKVDAYLLCQSQDRVAAKYRASATTAGKQVAAAPATPPCGDPGPFAYTPPAEKPLEAAGAHSPATTAASPPSTLQPAATANPTTKAQ